MPRQVKLSSLDPAVRTAIEQCGFGARESELGIAFREAKFVYGTQGSNVLKKVFAAFVDGNTRNASPERQQAAADRQRLKGIFDTGMRGRAFAHDDHGQMMDLYYGGNGFDTYKSRNAHIGKFVHKAMGFGAYDPQVPGYVAYWNTFGKIALPDEEKAKRLARDPKDSGYYEGWEEPPAEANGIYGGFHYPDFDNAQNGAVGSVGISATKYMSRCIRQAIAYFGGTLVFEGAEVYYEAVFTSRSDFWDSDTALEARALFPFFGAQPGKSKVEFGCGSLIFHWFGKEAVPTKALFRENWGFFEEGTHREGSSLEAFNVARASAPTPKGPETFSELWDKFPENDAANQTRAERLSWAREYKANRQAEVLAISAGLISAGTNVDPPVRAAIDLHGGMRGAVGDRFRASKFVYGTQGSNVLKKVFERFVEGKSPDAALGRQRLKGIFDTGLRGRAFAHDVNGQMMDLYYGGTGYDTYKSRDPLIGSFVHAAMGFAGVYDQDIPGYESYWKTFGKKALPPAEAAMRLAKDPNDSGYYEGWEQPPTTSKGIYDGFHYPNPENAQGGAVGSTGLSATKYMSRCIRQAIAFFGGTLVFDGAEVYYEAVFTGRPPEDFWDSDTAVEARALFPFFATFPRKSKVDFGRGKLIFHWFGTQAVPTKALFRENWGFLAEGTHREGSSLDAFNDARANMTPPKPPEIFSALWEKFPDDDPRNPSRAQRLRWAHDYKVEHSDPDYLAASTIQNAWRRRINKQKRAMVDEIPELSLDALPDPEVDASGSSAGGVDPVVASEDDHDPDLDAVEKEEHRLDSFAARMPIVKRFMARQKVDATRAEIAAELAKQLEELGAGIAEPELIALSTFIGRTSLWTVLIRSAETKKVDQAYDAYRATAGRHPEHTSRGMQKVAVDFFISLDELLRAKGGDWAKVKRNTASGGLLETWHLYLGVIWAREINEREAGGA